MVYLRKVMSSIFFQNYFLINYALNSMYIMFNETFFNEKFLLREIYNNNKTKVKIL